MRIARFAAIALLSITASLAFAADPPEAPQPPKKLTSSDVRDKPAEWYASDEGVAVVEGILAAQLPSGGWRKGYNLLNPIDPAEKVSESWTMGTFDNNTTYTELRVLAEAYRQTQRQDLLDAFNRGLDFIFSAQYPNGGWPQRWPAGGEDYAAHITLNDHAMTRVMGLLLDVATKPEFAFVDQPRRSRARSAFDRGVECLLAMQVRVDGKLTGWGQQHDHETLDPTSARTYELPSLASDETVGVVRLLMRIERPDAAVREAVHAGVAWLEASKVEGIRLDRTPDPSLPKGYDIRAVDDPNAEVLWARFYEVDTNRPFFCGRDGVKKYAFNEIDAERRAGYAWLRPYAKDIPQEYAAWKSRIGE